MYVDVNVVVGPSAVLWPQSQPLLPQHEPVEQCGGGWWKTGELIWSNVRASLLSIRDGNGVTDRHCILSLCAVSNKNLVYVLGILQRT